MKYKHLLPVVLLLLVVGFWSFNGTKSPQTGKKSADVVQADQGFDEKRLLQKTTRTQADTLPVENDNSSGVGTITTVAELPERNVKLNQLVINDPKTQRFFGKGASFGIHDLPDGNLKKDLLALNPANQAIAIKWLHTFSFSGLDAVESLRADSKGGIYYKCSFSCAGCNSGEHDKSVHATEATGSAIPTVDTVESSDGEKSTGEPVVAAAAVPISSPPVYNSKPGSVYTMYLDFNGAVITGKQWNTSEGVASWTAKAYSSDADLTTFSDTEQTFIRRVWERIAEDYAPFDINVTTDVAFDPVNYAGDKNKVAWNLFCPRVDANGVDLPHAGSGGIAYVGVFGLSNFFSAYQPAFTKAETSESADIAAEAGSHEVGHNMGLSHDTRSNEGYYGGHTGAGAPSWGPIMGTGYNRNVSQWSKGEYYDSKHADWNGTSYDNNANTNDDLVIIAARTNYRTDDHGDTNGIATGITAAGDGSFNRTGIIERTSETDVFSFSTGAGSVTINANPFKSDTSYWGGNLDINLELYNSGGTLIASNNPNDNVTAAITTTLAAGTYYIHIKPSSAGNASGTGSPYDSVNSTRAGYTVYASLGKYTISGSLILPGVNIVEAGGTNVIEGGATDTYTISLGTAPTSNVTVSIAPNAQVTTSTSSVTFTTANWNTPQSVTVTAVDDATTEGNHTGLITHTATSSDPSFNGISIGSVIVNITDNDNIELTAPNGGESWVTGVSQNITWTSLMGGNVKIELLKNGTFDSTIIASTPNDGSHSWSIPTGQTIASDYKIRITSVEQPTKTDQSASNFSIISDPLEDALETNGLTWTASGSLPWFKQTTTTKDGVDAAQSGAITHSQSSSLETTIVGPGTMTFWWKVSSETNYDFLRLFLNGVEQTGSLARISGTVDWIQKTVTIPTGSNVVRWSYTKDSSESLGFDTAWVDQVVFTPAAVNYTVNYNGNGNTSGTVPVDSNAYNSGATATVLGNTGSLAKTGSTFAGWNTAADGSGTNYSAGNTFTVSSNTVLYAKWTTLPTYTVTYNGNTNTGGTAPSNQTKIQGTNLTLATNSGNLVKTGYTFSGWNTAANGSGTDYAAGATYSSDANLTLYAKWIVTTYTVTYSGNGNTGGTAPGNQTKTYGVNLTLATNSGNLVKTGSTFAGWNTAANGTGTDYAPGANYTGNANLTLYAKWTLNTYTVTYNGNTNTGGTTPGNQIKTYGVGLILETNSGNLVKIGYTFMGWNTNAAGTGTDYAPGANYTGNANLNLYAKWAVNVYTVTYDGNNSTSGSVPVDSTGYNHGNTATVLANGSLARQPYTFDGWNTAADGSGTTYVAGNTFSVTESITLYAQWLAGPVAVYEPFVDSDPSLSGNSTGVGLTGSWSAAAGGTVLANSLTYGTLPTSGNKISIMSGTAASATLSADLANSGLLTNGSTLWFSFIVNTNAASSTNDQAGFALGTAAVGSGNNMPIAANQTAIGVTYMRGNRLNGAYWNGGNNVSGNLTSGLSLDTPTLIVGKIEWGGTDTDAEVITLYKPSTDLVQPSPYTTYTAIALPQTTFTTISIARKGGASQVDLYDEIRFGSTYDAVIGKGSTPYEEWSSGTFTNTFTDTLLTSNPDGDSLTNLQEFAFGMDPTTSATSPLGFTPGGEVTQAGVPILRYDASKYHAVFPRRKDHAMAGLTYTVEFSADLKAWESYSTTTGTVLTGAGSSELEAVSIEFPATVPVDGGGAEQAPKFFRVGVVGN
jgi:uncharacterized repeat protein (TIGR02543 family)